MNFELDILAGETVTFFLRFNIRFLRRCRCHRVVRFLYCWRYFIAFVIWRRARTTILFMSEFWNLNSMFWREETITFYLHFVNRSLRCYCDFMYIIFQMIWINFCLRQKIQNLNRIMWREELCTCFFVKLLRRCIAVFRRTWTAVVIRRAGATVCFMSEISKFELLFWRKELLPCFCTWTSDFGIITGDLFSTSLSLSEELELLSSSDDELELLSDSCQRFKIWIFILAGKFTSYLHFIVRFLCRCRRLRFYILHFFVTAARVWRNWSFCVELILWFLIILNVKTLIPGMFYYVLISEWKHEWSNLILKLILNGTKLNTCLFFAVYFVVFFAGHSQNHFVLL